ncbi:conserved hypothetical protein [Streptomyces viridosporus ATCC 14672]|uniref:Uncharacterized protein n=1 Tax=Streptomyces viridosporus (strain ATCC 14672 / DSM 40746 / JCM 4963 / KCTC 9882 / NRRL B-12104 / FH 1290) TaxID=566461 RepID=D6A0H3_STRV1|nr:hypothetical protein [Streptomyces viridosporus]EFE67394.1 conserved hypothetical protein [Streptomyces viridosporus ATCC 14672]
MEQQRIGSSSQPLEGAGFDPAFIPGLTAPASGPSDREEDAKPKAEEPAGAAPEPEDAVPGTEAGEETAPEEGAAPDGPVFEASDRRARIVADHRGVRLRLDDQECDFRWDEIGAVETETARFGKRWTVTVHTSDRRWYFLEVEAPSRSRFEEWDTELDAVLDAYFDDGGDGGGEPAEETEAADGTKADGATGADGDAGKTAEAVKAAEAAGDDAK